MFLRLWPSEKLLYIPIESKHIELLFGKLSLTKQPGGGTSNTSTAKKPAVYKMGLSPKSLAGPGYIILNGIRVMNVIGLLAVITASIVMLVKTSVASKFFFFDAVSHVLTAITGMFLCASELSLFRAYYARNWPLLSPSHGFVTMALMMIVLGVDMLGNLNKQATSKESLGLAFWRIVIASGIVIFILGWINLIASYVFRDRKQGITARQVRAHGAVAVHKTPITSVGTPPAPVLAQSYISNPITPSPSKSGKGFFRFPTSGNRQSVLPSYHSSSPTASPTKPQPPVSPESRYSRATNCTKKKVLSFMGRRQSLAPPLPVNTLSQYHHGYAEKPMEISGPMGVNPQFAHLVQRPDSALHPSRSGESEAFRWRV